MRVTAALTGSRTLKSVMELARAHRNVRGSCRSSMSAFLLHANVTVQHGYASSAFRQRHLSSEGLRGGRLLTRAAFDINSIPREALIAGGALLVGILGAVGWQINQDPALAAANEKLTQDPATSAAPPPPPRENAVLVLGATGRMGRKIVQKLLQAGRTVVAAVRSDEKAQEVFSELGLQEGIQQDTNGTLFIESGVDVTKPESLADARVWKGVTQVVTALGAVFGPQPGGGMGYIDNLTPERVEAEGIQALMAALPQHVQRQVREGREILAMRSAEDLTAWERLDDVIMGGQSSSGLTPAADGQGAMWRGDLIVEGGGFCGARTKKLDLDLSDADGLHLRVKGDGQIFKFNIKTTDQEDVPESTYQTTFDTVPDTWTDVFLPWHTFVPVKRAQSDPDGAPLDPSKISKFGLVLSRFEFNKMPNPSYKPGPFELLIDGGIRVYKDARPQIVMVSSAGVECNAIVGDDYERRKKQIPIVQLNPGGTLNHKYTAEIAIRSTGYPYAITRFTGLQEKIDGGPALLEADQGDRISGRLTRDDAADVIVAALSSPEAAYKTFEVRRSEATSDLGRAMQPRDHLRMFLKLALDRNRWRVGLPPFPKAMPPPPPITEQRKDEIIQDVQRVRAVNDAKDSAAAKVVGPAGGQEPATADAAAPAAAKEPVSVAAGKQ